MTKPTDQCAKLVEAGWQALEAGDIDHAEKACAAAMQCSPGSLEASSLQASVAMARGDLETSMSICREAMSAHPDDPRPYIQAAELALYSENDEGAIEYAMEAIDRAGDEGDFADALLIKASAELGADRDDDVRKTLAQLEGCVIDEPPLLYRLGELWLEVGDPTRARKAFRECLVQEPDAADAQHGLGLACEELGDKKGALLAWRRVRELDAARPMPAWHMESEAFTAVANSTLDELPQSILEGMGELTLVIEDTPSQEEVEAGCNPRLLGQLSDTDEGSLRLFQLNLERAVASRLELEDEIRATVLHEVAQHLGLDDDALDGLLEQA